MADYIYPVKKLRGIQLKFIFGSVLLSMSEKKIKGKPFFQFRI